MSLLPSGCFPSRVPDAQEMSVLPSRKVCSSENQSGRVPGAFQTGDSPGPGLDCCRAALSLLPPAGQSLPLG